MQGTGKHLCLAAAAFLAAYAAHVYLSRPNVPAPAGGRCHDARPADRDAAGGPYRHGAVSSDSAQCSRIGRDTMMQLNGSAVDAAIATLLCLGVVHPHSLGLGGGLLMTVYNKDTGTSQVINALDTAPLGSSEDMFAENPELSVMGGLSVAVPGQVRGLWEAHQRYGKLPWRDLFLPAIQLAEEGTCIGKHMARAIKMKRAAIWDRNNDLCDVFCDEHGAFLRENMTVKRPQLAKTLLAVANGGADAFYRGEIAKNLVKDIQNHGGIITEQDLLEYRAEVTSPLNTSLPGGQVLLTSPPPSGGATLILALNIFAGYGLNSSAIDGVQNQVLTYHRMLEAYKFSTGQETALGDPNFVNVEELTKRMVSKDFADELRRKIDDTRTFDSSYYGLDVPSPDIRGTSHVSVLGPNGDAVALTSSIGTYFGATFRSPSTGIILNNRMILFTLKGENLTRVYSRNPGERVHPGKRSKTAQSPTVVLDRHGDVILVIGASGGKKIASVLIDAIVHHLLFGMNISSAIEKPRLHVGVINGVCTLQDERHYPFKPEAVLHQLVKMHGKTAPELHQAIVQAVAREDSAISGSAREDSAIFAHSDSRKGGFPAGF
ncbi:glutathione hydrolase 1 proenzyme-like [Branchiostoma floridae]|uniref:Glutathione hydrolase n=1 Tax=Branchiostoma floridae TaxID=7739 RepID=A0A9J7LVL5_BRAFL|nr:glutathione hydrolase 1 proenzyme-like [Branchiostoma floridae]